MLAITTVVYATETLTEALWAELAPLLLEHYCEIAHYRDIPLAPSKEKYAQIAKNGGLRVYTARLESKLIGYLAVFVSENLHYKSIMSASQDVLYVDKEHRGSRTGIGLIRYCHDQLAQEGVTILFQHVKARADINIGPMLERFLGYELVDQIYAVRLDAGYDKMKGK